MSRGDSRAGHRMYVQLYAYLDNIVPEDTYLDPAHLAYQENS